MTKDQIYIAMFRAMDCLYDEAPDEELGKYLSEANPYLFKDRQAADPAIEQEFYEFIDKDMDSAEAYNRVKEYLSMKTNFVTIFSDITLEEWKNLCDMIVEES